MERVVLILRALLCRALSEHRSEPPGLADIVIERARGGSGPRLGVEFANGHRAWTALTASDCYEFCQRHSVWDVESLRRALLRAAQQIYAQIRDDHMVELRLHRRREQLEQLRRNTVSLPLIEQLRRAYEFEQQIQRHHRSRSADDIQTPPDSAFRARLRDWWARSRTDRTRSGAPDDNAFDDTGLAAAQDRGLQLLKQSLSPPQRRQYDKNGYFDVVGGETGKRYRIRHGCQMNIDALDKRGRVLANLCFMPAGGLVAGDVMLAQKMALELFESDALKVANKFPVHHFARWG